MHIAGEIGPVYSSMSSGVMGVIVYFHPSLLQRLYVHRAVVFLRHHGVIIRIGDECTGSVCRHNFLK